jgi:hypothetical protein
VSTLWQPGHDPALLDLLPKSCQVYKPPAINHPILVADRRQVVAIAVTYERVQQDSSGSERLIPTSDSLFS